MIFLKWFLGIVALAGVSSAVGIPAVLGAQSKGGASGRGYSTTEPQLTKCDSSSISSGRELSFGGVTDGDFCWTIEGESETGTVNNNEGEYTSFFKEEWSKTHPQWKDRGENEKWTLKCEKNEKKWSIGSSTSTEGESRLGLCADGSEISQTSFIKREEKSGVTTLSLCISDCWTETTSETGVSQELKTPWEEKWKKVKFYSKKVS
ncbi:hypothetical protein [Candidatus Mycoplasma haematominutum]|uniref:Uncharacterized protein n=1 Tax=Candidatus Mycoplasma haematominutum 'Birmingham 1' TaxID=1116213 RepID=G8C3V1_9MOLU|nr:hypothetical protein [Candidatus Mycoplasma haematominutum]CCE66999.1 hypothetical protein MHM_04810 [Candidatus Mycoplasma haematominutum 'Birmingham 1']